MIVQQPAFLELDPLIAEANRRARKRRLVIVALVVVVLGGAAAAAGLLRGAGGSRAAGQNPARTRGNVTQPSRRAVGCTFACSAVQGALDAAVGGAQRIAGASYYTGAVVNDPAGTVTLYLAHAPTSTIARLKAAFPQTYVIHNAAPMTLRSLMTLMRTINVRAREHGISIVSVEPRPSGFLKVGVGDHVARAREQLDAIYGPNVVRVFKSGGGALLTDIHRSVKVP